MLNLILGDQLFESWKLSPEGDEFLMIESDDLCRRYRYHQQKIAFTLTCMRRFAGELREKGFRVHYIALGEKESKLKYLDQLAAVLKRLKIRELRVSQIPDRSFGDAIKKWSDANAIRIHWIESELFLTTEPQFLEAFGDARPFMKTFYPWQRKRLKILVDQEQKPVGGKWSFDEENRKKLPKKVKIPTLPIFDETPELGEVARLVRARFSDHPGDLDRFWLPTNRKEALLWLENFLSYRFHQFGPFEDALLAGEEAESDLLYHSGLSSLINVGLLSPMEVVNRSMAFADSNRVPLASLEGFVRQVIGWREFIKGVDLIYGAKQSKSNFFGHSRKLKDCWYDGATGLLPVDESIKRLNRRGYNHHIERLMVLSNVMLLSEIDPKEVHRWFMEMYIDSSEWVMGPNVYGMGQFSDGGIFATKPYICGSNYILKMSNYKEGPWCETWDALYWSFVDKNLDFFTSSPRMGWAGNMAKKMSRKKLDEYHAIANAFRARVSRR